MYYAQSLFKAGLYPDASRVAAKIDSSQHYQRVSMLQASIKFEQDEIIASRAVLNGCLKDDPETIMAYSAISFKEGKFEDALNGYTEALNTIGFQYDLAYNVAACHYKIKNYEKALDLVSDIVDKAHKDYPDISVGTDINGIDSQIPGIDLFILEKTKLIEAYNLKAAINFDRKSLDAAKSAMNNMPTRREEELDPVTLHNQGLVRFEEDPTTGLRKLSFLLSNPPFPPETFGNLLLLYSKHGYHDMAAEILAENSHLTYDLLSQELYEYLDATIMMSTSPKEAYRKFNELSAQHVQRIQKLSKALSQSNESKRKDILQKYEEEIGQYIPVLMAQAKLFWEKENYSAIEKLLRQSADCCGDNEVWSVNLAHAFFMQQGSKFKEAIRYYDPIVKRGSEQGGILEVHAIVLANLCVAYIMTNQNENAEEIMKLIEKAEERLTRADSTRQFFHSCIVNLVIGTLYCEKGNFEFGISRICKSLEPYEKKLGPDTWFYTKRCFLAMTEMMAKQMLTLKDDSIREILLFLDAVDIHGKDILPTAASIVNPIGLEGFENKSSRSASIAHEAREIKLMFIKLT